ncbi:hypothetical protein DPMN_106343 [Dreissena polymorpha]|uniref:Uncharacterized protein n=1 Tax=Dreissena polymorpha TaxID=45954 RepID=A0A9D4QIN6_DREPO|nr:hypothetical protein DPMN_106343 [Dreissena polymorpha]
MANRGFEVLSQHCSSSHCVNTFFVTVNGGGVVVVVVLLVVVVVAAAASAAAAAAAAAVVVVVVVCITKMQNVASRVFTRNQPRPQRGHILLGHIINVASLVFTSFETKFELSLDIVNIIILTKFHQN